MSYRHAFIPVLGHELHVTEWGDPANPALIMWHGLARTGRDFDELASALSDRFFVLCPDTIGRGLSSWSQDPEADYSIEHYCGIATGMLDHYGISQTGWIGTSMGGLIGMRMASGPHSDRVSWLIINDIGPEVPQDAIDRILTYAGEPVHFATVTEAEGWLRTVYTPFGPAADPFWARMARTSVRRLPDGGLTTHFDPKITIQFTASPDEMTTWDRWERISIPVHVVAGITSDILPATILSRMQDSGPRPAATVYDDCGHAPTLSRPGDIALVRGIITGFAG